MASSSGCNYEHGICLFLGLAQYSGDPKTEWHLNSHRTRKELLEAVANLPYKGGNTLTGKSCFILIYMTDPTLLICGETLTFVKVCLPLVMLSVAAPIKNRTVC